MISPIRSGMLKSAGVDYNLILGFIPSYIRIVNANATTDEMYLLEWWHQMGDSAELQSHMINAGGAVITPLKASGSGYVKAYDGTNVPGGQFLCTFANATEIITATRAKGHGFIEGEKIRFTLNSSGVIPTGLAVETTYYVKYIDAATFQVALTSGGSAINFTDDGTAGILAVSMDNMEPSVDGGKGVTIAAAFSADEDILFYIAIAPERDVDHGDVA